MNGHTPGPWVMCQAFGQQGLIGPEGADPVASVTGYYTRVGQSEANARLIAAAPELLEALQIARDYAAFAQAEAADLALIDAAIAKATGAQS